VPAWRPDALLADVDAVTLSPALTAATCICCCCCLLRAVQVPAWRPEAFLAHLDPATLSPALTARLCGNAAIAAASLYGAFIESPNFAFWFQQRRAPVLQLVDDEVSVLQQGAEAPSLSLGQRVTHVSTRVQLYIVST
jgi:hypothetical protein